MKNISRRGLNTGLLGTGLLAAIGTTAAATAASAAVGYQTPTLAPEEFYVLQAPAQLRTGPSSKNAIVQLPPGPNTSPTPSGNTLNTRTVVRAVGAPTPGRDWLNVTADILIEGGRSVRVSGYIWTGALSPVSYGPYPGYRADTKRIIGTQPAMYYMLSDQVNLNAPWSLIVMFADSSKRRSVVAPVGQWDTTNSAPFLADLTSLSQTKNTAIMVLQAPRQDATLGRTWAGVSETVAEQTRTFLRAVGMRLSDNFSNFNGLVFAGFGDGADFVTEHLLDGHMGATATLLFGGGTKPTTYNAQAIRTSLRPYLPLNWYTFANDTTPLTSGKAPSVAAVEAQKFYRDTIQIGSTSMVQNLNHYNGLTALFNRVTALPNITR